MNSEERQQSFAFKSGLIIFGIIASILAFCVANVDAVGTYPAVDPSMVLYYHFNNQSSVGENATFVYDWSDGNRNNGSVGINGSYVPNSSILNDGSFNFTGSGTYGVNGVTVQDSPSLNISSTEISILAWVKIYSNGTEQIIVSKGNRLWSLGITVERKISSICTGLSDCTISNTAKILDLNTWYRLAFTYNKSQICVYYNGILDDCDPSTGNFSTSTVGLGIGNMLTGTNRPLNGLIDEVIIYNRSLSGTEILYEYNVYTGLECTNNPSGNCQISAPTNWTNLNFQFQNNDNVTFMTGGILNVTSSKINFTSGQMISTDISSIINIRDSFFVGKNKTDSVNRLRFTRSSNNPYVNIFNTTFDGFNILSCNGMISNFTVKNSSLLNFYSSTIGSFSCNNVLIDNSIIQNSSSASEGYGIWLQTNQNTNVTNTLINNTRSHGLRSTSGSVGTYVSNVRVYNSLAGAGIFFQDANNTIIENSYVSNVSLYAYDFLGTGYNNLIRNSVANGYGDFFGIAFSYDNPAGNMTSINNTVLNGIGGTGGISFNGINGGYSLNDYIENHTSRGLSLSTNVSNIYVENLTVKNVGIGIKTLVNIENVTIINFTSISNDVTISISSTNNLTLKNSLMNSGEDHYGEIILSSQNIFFDNVLGKSFYVSNATSLFFNLSSERLYFISNGSISNLVEIRNNTQSLIYTSNGSLPCGSQLVTGNCNITLQPNNSSCAFDNANLTEGVSRGSGNCVFPITLNSDASNEVKSISSNLTDILNISVRFWVNDCNINSITYNGGATSSYTCNSNIVTINSAEIPGGNSHFLVVYNGVPQNTCNTALEAFTNYPALIGLIGTVFLLGMAIIFVGGYGMFKSGTEVTSAQVGIFFLTIVGIGVLVIVGIIMIATVCSTGVI